MRKHPVRTTLVAALLGCGVSLGALAQGGTPSAGSGAPPTATRDAKADNDQSKLPRDERKFLEHAAVAGMAEVELGQMAQQKAASDQVKQFGARMVQDHGRANDELKALASAKGLTLPTELDRHHRREAEKLQKLSGAEFDRAYVDSMLKDHKKDVKDFEKQAKSAKDPDVKAFAGKTLPVLQEHLKMVQSLHDAMGKGSRTSDARSTGAQPATGTATTAGAATGTASPR